MRYNIVKLKCMKPGFILWGKSDKLSIVKVNPESIGSAISTTSLSCFPRDQYSRCK